MRPLELRLRNFRSYFGPETVFDFRHRSLVGVVGPIGSGKSSLLDAMAFALYGRTPSEGQATSRLVHQRADHGAVQLRFEVEGETWEAVRVLRRKGQSQHALYRYEVDTAGAEPVEKVTQERQVNDRIRELLGLDFDTFCRSVLLAQGRFAEFLKGQPADRDRVLKGVFGHDRIDHMREVAKARVASLGAQCAGIDGQLVQIDALEARVVARVAELEVAETTLETLAKAEPTVDDLDRRIAEARSAAEEAGRRRDEILPLGDLLPTTESADDLEGRLDMLADRRRQLAKLMEEAATERQDADTVLDELETAGEQALVESAEQAISTHRVAVDQLAGSVAERDRVATQLDQRRAEAVTVTGELDAAEDEERRRRKAATEAEEAAGLARTERHDASHRHMAASLRGALSPGDECPVCLRMLDTPPPSVAVPDLDDATAAEAAAEAAVRVAADQASAAVAETVRLHARSVALGEEAKRLEAELARVEQVVADRRLAADGAGAEVGRILGEGDPVELLEWRRTRLGEARKVADAARRRFESARTDHQRAVDDATEAQGRIDDVRRAVDRVAGGLGVADPVDADTTGRFGAFVATIRQAWSARVEECALTVAAADADLAGAADERAVLMAELEVVDGSFRDTLAAIRATVDRLTKDIAAEKAEIAGAEALRAEREGIVVRSALFDRIARDLNTARFVRYLLDDERARLAELGGEHFMRLTSGRYRFTEDGDFRIVDLTAADAVRTASSLSGGETFLASLALALALAEMVTRTGGRLDAFFLDEGFGSLDQEHLDLAMDGIEELVADGSSRLVVVVSHVGELRERIEDLIELDKDPVTGDTRVKKA